LDHWQDGRVDKEILAFTCEDTSRTKKKEEPVFSVKVDSVEVKVGQVGEEVELVEGQTMTSPSDS